MKAKISPSVIRLSINGALADSKMELLSLYQAANEGIPEVVLTEFAARLCYNSTARLGTDHTFVSKILQHGHLSVAEHASVAVALSRFGVTRSVKGVNRFFNSNGFYTSGNMRSWMEYLSSVNYTQMAEVFIAIFPPAFKQDAFIKEFDPETFKTPVQFYVPGMDNVQLLAVNFGNLPKINHMETREESRWGRFTFLVEDISRACSHQIARHRGASISEQSQRYVDATRNPGFVYPPDVSGKELVAMEVAYNQALFTYKKLREAGVRKEDARFVLPMSTKTRMLISFDKAELAHFLRVRCARDAQWEVREVARKMAKQAALATEYELFVSICDEFQI